MHADLLYSRSLAAILHLSIEKAFVVGKQSVRVFQAVAMGHILLETIAEGCRYSNDPVALWRFGAGDNIPAVEPLIALIDGDRSFLEVYIGWGTRDVYKRQAVLRSGGR